MQLLENKEKNQQTIEIDTLDTIDIETVCFMQLYVFLNIAYKCKQCYIC